METPTTYPSHTVTVTELASTLALHLSAECLQLCGQTAFSLFRELHMYLRARFLFQKENACVRTPGGPQPVPNLAGPAGPGCSRTVGLRSSCLPFSKEHTMAASLWDLDLFRQQFPCVQIASLKMLNDSVLNSPTLDKEVVSTVLRDGVLPEIVKWTELYRRRADSNNKPILNSLLPTLKGLSLGLNGVEPNVASVVFDGAHTDTQQNADAVAYVVDKELYEEKGHLIDFALVCKLVIEEKPGLLKNWLSGPGGCFHLGAYMLDFGMQNFKSGHRSPIYGIGLARDRWASTELRVDGIVKIINGDVRYVSDDMSPDAQLRIDNLVSQARIRDGEHIVARYYISDEPAMPFSWLPPTPPAYHLVSSLLKICIGAHVHDWSVADVKAKLAVYHDSIQTQACS